VSFCSDVFRSPRGRKGGYDRDNSNNPALQLPIIGQNDGTGTSKLSRKDVLRGDPIADDFMPPPLGIRSSSSGASREVYTREDGNEKPAATKSSSKDITKENESSEGHSTKKKGSKNKKNRKGAPHTGYIMPQYPPRGDGTYYPMPAMPPGGSMRVVVGGPPPMNSRPGSKNSSISPQRHSGPPSGSPPQHPHYPMPHDAYGAPPGSMYPPPPHYHHPPPHMGGPYGHYPHPPPRHMPPMYPTSHPSTKNSVTVKSNSKKSKGSKSAKSSAGAKRPMQVDSAEGISVKASPSKKARKSSPKVVAKKKAPTVTRTTATTADPADHQKAAATIAAVNAASGGNNDRAAALAAAILRGVTMRPSGKWVSLVLFAFFRS
jgi:hypothetical protein